MSVSQYQWHFSENVDNIEEKILELQNAGLNFSPAFLRLCLRRGLNTIEKIKVATDQQPQIYHDPYKMFDMQKAIERIKLAIEKEELILVYGDYDADGITSTLILVEALETLGANFSYYLPNRLVDGYGPNKERYQSLIADGVQLILTCDNGIAGFEAIDFAMQQGIDVIVTDHHEIQESLPNAYAIIHPRHPQGNYPFGELSGAGVALKVAHALLGELPIDSIELAAIGTIADLVSLTDENRTIVLSGLNLLHETTRFGLERLLQHESILLNEVTVDTVGFIIGPRLNAIGRLGDATPALELLRTIDEEQIDQLVTLINKKNRERQEIVSKIYQQVSNELMALPALPNIIIAEDKDWPAGVLGIVASKLTEQFNRPALIFQFQEAFNCYKGSGRSVDSINLFELLEKNKELLMHFGGHSQAAGLTVNKKDWMAFKQSIVEESKILQGMIAEPRKLAIDLSLTIEEINASFIEEVQLLSPFGIDNPKPLFEIYGVKLAQKRLVGQEKQHIKFVLSDDEKQSIEGIGFSNGSLFNSIEIGDTLKVVGNLELNEWNGKTNPQILLKDIKTDGLQIRDFRASKVNPKILSIPHALYFYYNDEVGHFLKKYIPVSSQMMQYQQIDTTKLNQFQHLVLMETPHSLAIFDQIIKEGNWSVMDLGVYQKESRWLAGLPNKTDFSQLYRLLYTNSKQLTRHEAISLFAKQLNIPIIKMRVMLNIFFEVQLIEINGDTIDFIPQNSGNKFDLTSTNAYNKYAQAYYAEEILNYHSINQIKKYIEELEN